MRGVAGNTEKRDKRYNNRVFRRKEKIAISQDSLLFPTMREVSDVWGMSKDGKFRFNPDKYPKLMRK